MTRTILIKVKNYHPAYINEAGVYASLASFRMELRGFLKHHNPGVYFGPSPVEGPKNMGCYLFGQPDTWKGVIGIVPEGTPEDNNIEVYVDFRNILEKDKLLKIMASSLRAMKKEGIIDDFELIFDPTQEA